MLIAIPLLVSTPVKAEPVWLKRNHFRAMHWFNPGATAFPRTPLSR
jgi:hypothetical protein